jgi:hypothetical protein
MVKKWRPECEYDKAIHKELEKKWGREYVPGSLRELDMIAGFFQCPYNEVTLYLLKDEFEPYIPSQGEECTVDDEVLVLSRDERYEKAFNVTTDKEVFINPEQRKELEAFGIPFQHTDLPREFRRLSHFLEKMRPIIMYKVCDERDFIERYCFLKMRWNGREVEHIYFNTHSRRTYFQLKPHE